MTLPETKICACCDEYLPLGAFNKRSAAKDGLQSYCRECNVNSAGRRKSYKKSPKGARQTSVGLLHCFKCGLDKPATAFTISNSATGHRFSQCKECCNRYRNSWRYGISTQQWEEMWSSQGGQCAICSVAMTRYQAGGKAKASAHVDHDHETSQVRALLCNECNRGIGAFKDKIHLLYAAADYLLQHSRT